MHGGKMVKILDLLIQDTIFIFGHFPSSEVSVRQSTTAHHDYQRTNLSTFQKLELSLPHTLNQVGCRQQL